MKIINKICVSLFTVFLLTSCSENYFDVNADVNNPTSSTPVLTLPVAQKQTMDLLTGGYNSYNTLGNLWTYQWAAGADFAFFPDEMRYVVNSTFRTGNFESAYLGSMANYNYVVQNTDPKYVYFKAISKIMLAFHFQYLVDAYGNVPYTEAFKRGGNTKPVYDSAQSIYNTLITELTAAQNLISSAPPTALAVGASDIMCGGDMNKWGKFANTLKLRLMLRQSSKVGNSISAATLTSNINASFGFLGVGETVYCNPGYLSLISSKQNPFWDAFKLDSNGVIAANGGATRATTYAVSNLLMQNTDLRKPLMWKKVGANYVGIPQNGLIFTALPSSVLSPIGDGIFKSANMPGIVMQSAESLFLQAEAAARFGVFGNDVTLYQQGVQENFNQLGAGNVPASEFSNTGSLYYDPANSPALKLQAIIKQKFIALISTNGYENWIEYRRTGYPASIPVARTFTSVSDPGTPVAPNVPVRLLYPSSEAATNPNVPVQSTSDAFNSKVFWQN